jgi:glycosyltransferase involved in cell wall biosynthesis
LPDPLPSNVTHHRGSWHGTELSDERIRALYQRAAVVVVPLRESNQPSGQSVTLQAMACGCPVVLTNTEGLWSRSQMIDGENVLLVPPGGRTELAASVNRLLGDRELSARIGRAGREGAEAFGSIEGFAARMASGCAAAVRNAAQKS